jgi:transcriptional regulator with XRE-family HTH domain
LCRAKAEHRPREKEIPKMARVPDKYRERYGKADTGRLPPGVSNPVDQHVGARLRQRRTLMGLSQEKLGEAVGLTFQQIQKYERGANRIGASRLYQFSEVLDVDISYFFEEMPSEIRTRRGAYNTGLKDQEQDELQPNPMARRETLELVRYYYRISDPAVRKNVFELAKTLARAEKD